MTCAIEQFWTDERIFQLALIFAIACFALFLFILWWKWRQLQDFLKPKGGAVDDRNRPSRTPLPQVG